jgi:hypothetical protein
MSATGIFSERSVFSMRRIEKIFSRLNASGAIRARYLLWRLNMEMSFLISHIGWSVNVTKNNFKNAGLSIKYPIVLNKSIYENHSKRLQFLYNRTKPILSYYRKTYEALSLLAEQACFIERFPSGARCVKKINTLLGMLDDNIAFFEDALFALGAFCGPDKIEILNKDEKISQLISGVKHG